MTKSFADPLWTENPDALVSTAMDGRVIHWNQAAISIFGYTAREAVGRSLIDLIVPAEYVAEEHQNQQDLHRMGLIVHEAVRRRKDNSLVKVIVSTKIISGPRKTFQIAVSSIKDLTLLRAHHLVTTDDVMMAPRHAEALQRAMQNLDESNRRFHDMLDHVELAAVMLDTEECITYCNDHLLQLAGWQWEEVRGRNWFDMFMPPELGDMRPVFKALLENAPEAWHREQEMYTRGKERRLLRWNNTVLRAASGEVIGIASIGEDITERKAAERKIDRLSRVHAVLSAVNSLIVRARIREELFNEACHIAIEHGQFNVAMIGVVDLNAAEVVMHAIAGHSDDFLEQIKGSLVLDGNTPTAQAVRERKPVICNDARADVSPAAKTMIAGRDIRSFAIFPLLIESQVVGTLSLCTTEANFFDAEEVKLLVELAGDIAFAMEHIAKEERLTYLSYYDAITGLPNRTLLLERISQHLLSHTDGQCISGLALIEIERFRIINDTFGRQAGDEMLKLVADRIRACTAGLDTCACVGVNCFAVAVYDAHEAGHMAFIVEQLLRCCFSQSFRVGETDLRVAGKAGIALYPYDGNDVEELYANAEATLQRAKHSAESLLFYAPDMNRRVAQALQLESKLRIALEQDQFVLHYQPKVSLVSGKLTGMEALIRWNDPETGLVAPAQFIPILEETGLIYEVGRWAMHKAVAQYLRWRTAGLPVVRIAVNVSPLQLRHSGFVNEIEQVIGVDDDAASGLELEITESQIMADVTRNTANLQSIRDCGVSIAIDDFGTGYSSLSLLAKLPADSLKIDRSFVVDMANGPQGITLVSTIINLAHGLNLKVVAEGVETEAQKQQLCLLHCDEMQGYLFSRPLPAEMFEANFLSSGRKPG